MKFSYTEPELCQAATAWFVHFRITNPLTGEQKPVQKRGGINYYPPGSDRLKAGIELRKFWKKKLEEGWHPFILPSDSEAQITADTPLNTALDFALTDASVAKKTKLDYNCTIRFCKTAATALSLSTLPISQLERSHVKMILNKAKKTRAWSNNAYNKSLSHLSAVVGRLVNWEVLKYNPVEKITRLPVTETRKYIPYTDEEKKKLQEYLFLNHYRYLVFLMVTYYTGLRPKEVLLLRVADVNLQQRTITILPDLDQENSKTKRIRLVPVDDHLHRLLREMELQNYPSDYFVFGRPDDKKRDAKDPRYFSPSAHSVKRDTSTKLWKRVVIDGLGINKHQYTMKHTGADDKILAGISLDALKELYGHSSKFMTENYVSVLKQLHRKEIIERSPSF